MDTINSIFLSSQQLDPVAFWTLFQCIRKALGKKRETTKLITKSFYEISDHFQFGFSSYWLAFVRLILSFDINCCAVD